MKQLIAMSAVCAGMVFCTGSVRQPRLPKGTTIDGVSVGRMTRAQAVSAVRREIETRLKEKTLTATGASCTYVFRYPQLTYRDDLPSLVGRIERAGEYHASVTYHVNGLSNWVENVASRTDRPVEEPWCEFSRDGFAYHEGQDGCCLDREACRRAVNDALSHSFESVELPYTPCRRRTTLQDLCRSTEKISSFSTNFDESNTSRHHNIALACRSIDGTTLQAGEEFSFNSVVGERTTERGFETAKVISAGQYVEGVGGGVCQVSTTLYNACLLAGCRVTEVHAHSLSVGYVPPSCDAMVSGGYCDLRFVNPFETPLYVSMKVTAGSLCCTIYGRPSGVLYRVESLITGTVPLAEGQQGKEGLTSQAYLLAEREGKTTRTFLRKDKYSPFVWRETTQNP